MTMYLNRSKNNFIGERGRASMNMAIDGTN